MSWRDLNRHGRERGADFYGDALCYGAQLWNEGEAARAVLAVDRALLANVPPDAAVLENWPLPYQALAFMFSHFPKEERFGNLRVHYQHLADRLRGERRELRSGRAWAAWALVREKRPELPADPNHAIEEPGRRRIAETLKSLGHPGEAELWAGALAG